MIKFPKDTPIRCNRCDAKGLAPQAFDANIENRHVWRQSGMMINPACGHIDGHWVFRTDIYKVSDVAQQAHALASGTLATLTGVKEFDALEEIQGAFVNFCVENWAKYERWQDAWEDFNAQGVAENLGV